MGVRHACTYRLKFFLKQEENARVVSCSPGLLCLSPWIVIMATSLFIISQSASPPAPDFSLPQFCLFHSRIVFIISRPLFSQIMQYRLVNQTFLPPPLFYVIPANDTKPQPSSPPPKWACTEGDGVQVGVGSTGNRIKFPHCFIFPTFLLYYTTLSRHYFTDN
jgi:hypothetical protein